MLSVEYYSAGTGIGSRSVEYYPTVYSSRVTLYGSRVLLY